MWRAVIAAMLLSACSAEQSDAPRAATDDPVVSVEGVTEWPAEFVWLRGQSAPETGWLTFQPDESDNIQIAFECAFASGAMSVEAFDPQQRGTELTLRSGNVADTFSAQPITDPTGMFFGDGVLARANVPIDNPVIVAFRDTGALSSGEPAIAYRTATPDELSRIDDFFAMCER